PVTAISRHERPAPAGPVAASLAFAWRSLLKLKHVPEQLGDVIGIPVVFTLLFTYLFGGARPARPTATCSSSCQGLSRWPSCSSPSTAASPSTPTSPPGHSTGSGPCPSGGPRRSSAR